VRLIAPDPDLLAQFDLVVDPDAEPVDADEVLVEFALRFLESIPAGASPEDGRINTEAKR